jgi:hypothetical protein
MDEARRGTEGEQQSPGNSDFAHSVLCPDCGHAYQHPGRFTSGFLDCPACHAQFLAPDATPREDIYDDTEEEPDDVEDPEALRRRQEELHYFRVRNSVLTERRMIARTRTYYLIGAVAFFVAGVQTAVMTYKYVYLWHFGWRAKPIGYVFTTISALLASLLFARRSAALSRELARPALEEPETPPDFSTLGDGSERWKNLEAMHGRVTNEDRG